MNRDVSKFLEESKKIKEKSGGKACVVFASDMQQLLELTRKDDRIDTAMLMWNSFDFGFIAGLHYAKNQRRKSAKQRF